MTHKICTLAAAAAMVLAAHGAMAQPMCPGDLGGDDEVTVDEILTSVNNALKGCPARFVDNNDGTISDNWTGLMWEKKSDDGSVHDWDNRYTWSTDRPWSPDGTAFTEFLTGLNGQTFAGYTDWRLPTIHELETLRDLERSEPAIDPVFHNNCTPGCTVTECSCTASNFYWAATTEADGPSNAWVVGFFVGGVGANGKTGSKHVRAVRGSP